ncbi:MAG: alkaline phosphatase family protein [Gemmatimonadetes bacterium]|nr:alkaline phosphatase family protein [Gemmatimonadota bacterium]
MRLSDILRATSSWLVLTFACACASAPGGAPASGATPPVQGQKPTLVVMLTVDQLRPDYLERFKGDLTRGFPRLLTRGAYFTNAHHDHAITETAPGHATLLTGRFPRSTGITRNIVGVNTPQFPLLVGAGAGAAPFRLRGTTLFDWLAAVHPGARALSVSAKDRSAILPVGRAKQEVYWYSDSGIFTTSTWYRAALPAWATAFNEAHPARAYAGTLWDLAPGVAFAEPDSVPVERGGRDFVYPHPFTRNPDSIGVAVRYSPMVDELTAQFAWRGFRELDLGRGPGVDLLAVSFSATDYVGHTYGPESREIHDNIVRLDRVLGAFLDSLYAIRDSSRIVFALSSDHGVQRIPELHGGVRVVMRPAMVAARALVRRFGGDTTAIDFESGGFFIEKEALAGGLTARLLTDSFMVAARKVNGVMRVERYDALARLDTLTDAIARRWVHMFPADIAPTAVVTLRPGSIYAGNVATHGTPHDADSHVPLLFVGEAFAPGRHDGFVRTVDLAATLAHALGIRPRERLDGRILQDAFRK